MKVSINEPDPVSMRLSFPALYRSRETGNIVLFVTETAGTLLTGANIGHHCSVWMPCANRGKWELLPPGTAVTLTQSFDEENAE